MLDNGLDQVENECEEMGINHEERPHTAISAMPSRSLLRIVVNGSGIKLANEASLKEFLSNKEATCLLDEDGDEVHSFHILISNASYTLRH